MTFARLAILLLGPLPIVSASFALTHWAKPQSGERISDNHVLAAEGIATHSPAADAQPDATLARLNSYLTVECKSVAERLRPQLGSECAILVREPFVLAGDLSEAELDDWHRRTIAPAARAMAHSYFRKPPTLPITILLFGGQASYDRYAKLLFNDAGVSVYGYYKPDRRTLVMNIATGGGTLVHELTHALIDFDFPAVPDWFNEGLASLHEQCRFLPDEAGIEGLPNWRLAGLQEAVRRNQLGTIAELIGSNEFRGRQVGLNYAQARYFCLYLQQRQLLEEFYRRLKAGQDRDPRGLAAVQSLFNDEERQHLDRDFRAWVLALKF